MKGNMSKLGLTTNMLISHAEINHGQTEVISVDVKGNVEKSTWKKIGRKARKIASALVKLGLKKVYTILEIADSISDAIVNGEKYLIEIGSKILTDLKKNPEKNQGFAEKEGFEPPEV